MLRGCIMAFVVALAGLNAGAQHYKYIDSTRVCGPASYKKQIKADSNKRLVDIIKFIPAIKLDIRYATANNFMHRAMYRQAKAYARLPVAKALRDVAADLKTKGLGLKIFDAYRPYAVTIAFYETAPDTNFVANPKFGSKHNRGCAIDLTLINLKTGKELDMPTGFDSFSKKASANYPGATLRQIANRELLKTIMHIHGFTVLTTEWWHYDFDGWPYYQLMDIPFTAL